jgi:hypothetical protein
VCSDRDRSDHEHCSPCSLTRSERPGAQLCRPLWMLGSAGWTLASNGLAAAGYSSD